MTLLSRLIAFAAILLGMAAAGCPALAQPVVNPSPSPNVAIGPSLVRPEFTRPGGIPGASRGSAGSNTQYMMAPAQPSDQASPSKSKRHK